MPLFSVIIPTYNRADVLLRSVQSVLAQTFEDFELIIVDDGSSDHTKDVISTLSDRRIKYIYQENAGRSAARNLGASQSKSKYLTFLDSDDEAAANWLQSIHEGFFDSEVSVVCCGATIVDGERSNTARTRLPRQLGPVYLNYSGLFAPPGTFTMRHEVFEGIGGYESALSHSENTDLALRIVSYCAQEQLKIHCIYRPLIVYNREAFRWAKTEDAYKRRLECAQYFLKNHGKRYLEVHPRGYANYCAIAGVNAARLHRYEEARNYFSEAIRTNPSHWRHYFRYILTMAPSITSSYWLRYRGDIQDQ